VSGSLPLPAGEQLVTSAPTLDERRAENLATRGNTVDVMVYDASTGAGHVVSASVQSVEAGKAHLLIDLRPETWSVEQLAERHGLAVLSERQDRWARARGPR